MFKFLIPFPVIAFVLATLSPATAANQAPPESKQALIMQATQAKRDILSNLYYAQLSLHQNQRWQGEKYIDRALMQMGEIPGKWQDDFDENELMDMFDDPVYQGRKVVEISFGSPLMPEQAIMPVYDTTLTVAILDDTLQLKGLEPGSVRDAKVRYIAFDVEKDDIREELLEAKQALEERDMYSAQYDLLQVQRDMLEDKADVVSPRIRARDHIALTRYLVQQQAYDAAREAWQEAEAALSATDKWKDQATVHNMREQLSQLDEKIDRNHDTMVEQIDDQLQQWWQQLS